MTTRIHKEVIDIVEEDSTLYYRLKCRMFNELGCIDAWTELIDSYTYGNNPGLDICQVCGCVADYPYRRYIDVSGTKRVVQGCIGKVHTGRLTNALDRTWHNRPEAVTWRERTGL